MKRNLLTRIVAALLVLCLLADPFLAVELSSRPSLYRSGIANNCEHIFTEEALELPIASAASKGGQSLAPHESPKIQREAEDAAHRQRDDVLDAIRNSNLAGKIVPVITFNICAHRTRIIVPFCPRVLLFNGAGACAAGTHAA